MIELSEESQAEFKKETAIIAQSLSQCADRFNLEEEISFFQSFVHQALTSSSFEEEDYLGFATNVIKKLKGKTSDKEATILLVNLSRLDSEVSSVYNENELNPVVAQAIAESPDYFTTPFNRVMVFDYLYSHYYWRAQEIFREGGISQLLDFLTTTLKEQAVKGEEIITSILSSFMSIYFKDDKVALEEIILRFGYIKTVEKKGLRLLSRA